jgi:hypothetical protein
MSRKDRITEDDETCDRSRCDFLNHLTGAPAFTKFGRWSLLVVLSCSAIPLVAGNVVTEWNTIASTVIVKNGGKAPSSSPIWFAYTSLAVYDAVNAITGQNRPFYYRAPAPRNASLESAAAAAAYRILVNYFPAQQSDLNAKFALSLAAINAETRAKEAGVAVGEAAAAALIAARTGDGLEADVPYVHGSGPGMWLPTPPAFAPAGTPWLQKFRPFTMTTAADFRPDGPTPLNSEAWKRDYNLTRLFGGANGSVRSATQTEIGIFWTEHPPQQYARAFGYLADNYRLNVSDTARLLAMLWTGYSDAITSCFEAKYAYSFWRPATATVAGGGNSDLQADPAWSPLAATPNHPEYPAAHACAGGAVVTVLGAYFGTTKIHLVTDSTAFQDGVHTHKFEDSRDLLDEVFWARIYAGFHYFHSLDDGEKLGTTVARELLRHHFGPQHGRPEFEAAVKK